MKKLSLVLFIGIGSLFASNTTDNYKDRYQMGDAQKGMSKEGAISMSDLLQNTKKTSSMKKKKVTKKEAMKCGSVKIETH